MHSLDVIGDEFLKACGAGDVARIQTLLLEHSGLLSTYGAKALTRVLIHRQEKVMDVLLDQPGISIHLTQKYSFSLFRSFSLARKDVEAQSEIIKSDADRKRKERTDLDFTWFVGRLLAQPDLNMRAVFDYAYLQDAIKYGDYQLFRALEANRFPFDSIVTPGSRNLLMQVICGLDMHQLELIEAADEDLKFKLQTCAIQEKLAILETLLRAGVDPDLMDKTMFTPLRLVCHLFFYNLPSSSVSLSRVYDELHFAYAKAVEFLCAYGAKIHSYEGGYTVLHTMCSLSYHNAHSLAVLTTLLAQEGAKDVLKIRARTEEDGAVTSVPLTVALSSHNAHRCIVVKKILEVLFPPGMSDKKKSQVWTELGVNELDLITTAIIDATADFFNLLLDFGIPVAKFYLGGSLLHFAAEYYHDHPSDDVEVLADRKAILHRLYEYCKEVLNQRFKGVKASELIPAAWLREWGVIVPPKSKKPAVVAPWLPALDDAAKPYASAVLDELSAPVSLSLESGVAVTVPVESDVLVTSVDGSVIDGVAAAAPAPAPSLFELNKPSVATIKPVMSSAHWDLSRKCDYQHRSFAFQEILSFKKEYERGSNKKNALGVKRSDILARARELDITLKATIRDLEDHGYEVDAVTRNELSLKTTIRELEIECRGTASPAILESSRSRSGSSTSRVSTPACLYPEMPDSVSPVPGGFASAGVGASHSSGAAIAANNVLAAKGIKPTCASAAAVPRGVPKPIALGGAGAGAGGSGSAKVSPALATLAKYMPALDKDMSIAVEVSISEHLNDMKLLMRFYDELKKPGRETFLHQGTIEAALCYNLSRLMGLLAEQPAMNEAAAYKAGRIRNYLVHKPGDWLDAEGVPHFIPLIRALLSNRSDNFSGLYGVIQHMPYFAGLLVKGSDDYREERSAPMLLSLLRNKVLSLLMAFHGAVMEAARAPESMDAAHSVATDYASGKWGFQACKMALIVLHEFVYASSNKITLNGLLAALGWDEGTQNLFWRALRPMRHAVAHDLVPAQEAGEINPSDLFHALSKNMARLRACMTSGTADVFRVNFELLGSEIDPAAAAAVRPA